jgi:hypothetical protein
MRTLLSLSLIAASSTCTDAPDRRSPAPLAQAPAPSEVDDPMADFARLVGGEWRATFASGESAFHAWQWGPGKRSLRRMAYGLAEGSFAGSPWVGEVLYWHPGLEQVRMLSVHGDIPGVGRGVGEGTIRFDGETSRAEIELEQPRGRRMLGQVQEFDGVDRYRELLLEDTGAGPRPLNELTFVRDRNRTEAATPAAEPAAVALPERWHAFEGLPGSWGTADAGEGAPELRTTFAWEPSLEIVFARTQALHASGEPTDVIDAYVFRDVRTDALRCLVLTERGDVAEGTASVAEGGGLQFDLLVHRGDRVVPHVARFALEQNGRLRTRLWALDGAERTLALDVLHRKLER